MATPRNYSMYPAEFTELFLAALRAPVVVPCGTKAEAKKYRGQLYAFRTSLAVPNCGAPPEIVIAAPLLGFRVDEARLVVYKPERKVGMIRVLEKVKANTAAMNLNVNENVNAEPQPQPQTVKAEHEQNT